MSIPKEPRQLMINIMYLVLTALLALNVSAEIFNAFKIVDKGLEKSNLALDGQNQALPPQIKKSAKRDTKLQIYADRTDSVTTYGDEASKYFQNFINKMIDETGDKDGVVGDGDYIIKEGIRKDLKGKKNKDYSTRVLFTQGEGEKIKQYIIDTKQKLANLADPQDRDSIFNSLALDIDDETWKQKKKSNWSEMNFKQMPTQAVIPIFTKFINDVKSSESTMMNYLASKVGLIEEAVMNQFNVTASPKKSYIIKGDPYEAEIFLTAFSSGTSKTGISVSVNGQSLPVNAEGKAVYKATPNALGEKKYTAKISVTNPVTNETKSYEGQFSYEVGERSLTVSASKMNVFYVGVPNPVEVAAAGVNSNDINVSMDGGDIKRQPDGTYIVTVSRPTAAGQFAKINVTAPGLSDSRPFRVKMIPDPVAKLSKSRGGKMSTGEFKAQQAVLPILENFDFEAKCNIAGYRVVRVASRQDPVVSINGGGIFSAESRRIIDQAKPGDKFYFEDIKCKCPGDSNTRDLGTLSFQIN